MCLYICLYFFILIADTINFIPLINYWDECLTIFIPIFLFCYRKKISIDKTFISNIFILLIILLIGVLGNIVYSGIQSNNTAILKDIFAFLKFPALMLILRSYSNDITEKYHERIVKNIAEVSKFLILISGIFAIISKPFDLGMYTGEIRFIECYSFIFSHPTFYVSMLVFCISILVHESRAKNKFIVLIGCVLLFLTQRTKAYAIIIIIIFCLFMDEAKLKLFVLKNNSKINIVKMLPFFLLIGIIIFLVFINKFRVYLSYGISSARIALYVIGVIIAIQNFPLGSGFGTFASSLSGEYYSNIYYIYDIFNVDGLRPDKFNYMADTFWPWIYGQLGFFGFILYLILMLNLFNFQFKKMKKCDHVLAFLIIWIYALIASTSEAFFTNTTGVMMAVILNLYIRNDSSIKQRKNIS